MIFFFFKQKTAYEMRISDWSSDVCSSDLAALDDFDVKDVRREDRRHARTVDTGNEEHVVGDVAQRLHELRPVDVAIVALQRDEYGVGAAEIIVVLQEGLHVRMLLRHHLQPAGIRLELRGLDRKSTRLHSSH